MIWSHPLTRLFLVGNYVVWASVAGGYLLGIGVFCLIIMYESKLYVAKGKVE